MGGGSGASTDRRVIDLWLPTWCAPHTHPSQISTSQAPFSPAGYIPSTMLVGFIGHSNCQSFKASLARVLRKTWVCRIVRLRHPPPLQLSVGRLQATTIALHLALPSHHCGQDAFAPPSGDPSRQCEGPRKTTIGERWTSVAEQTKGLTRDKLKLITCFINCLPLILLPMIVRFLWPPLTFSAAKLLPAPPAAIFTHLTHSCLCYDRHSSLVVAPLRDGWAHQNR